MKKKLFLVGFAILSAVLMSVSASALRMSSLPVTMKEDVYTYIEDDSITIKSFEVTKVENLAGQYKNRIHYSLGYSENGYVSLVMICYDASGYPVSTLDVNKYMTYIDVPDTTATIEFTIKSPEANSDTYMYCKYVNLYSYSGAIAVTDLQVPVYKMVGWYEGVTMYAYDGRSIEVSPFQVEAYENVGWSRPVTMYKDSNSIDVSPYAVESYENSGWQRGQIMYSIDGRTIEVSPYEADNYAEVGWYYPVTVYALDGRSLEISPFHLADYQNVGWYTASGYIYYDVQQRYNRNKANGDYYANIELAYDAWEYLEGTEYESSVLGIFSEAKAYLLKHTRGPIYIVGSSVTEDSYSKDINIRMFNVSDKDIIAFKCTFDIYDIFGSKLRNPYDNYVSTDAGLDSGDTTTYTWDLYTVDTAYSIKNIRITEVVYSDGTKWYR